MITDLSQVDKALQDALGGLIIEGKEVPVLYMNPEAEFMKGDSDDPTYETEPVYPALTFYRAGAYPDVYRDICDKVYTPVMDSQGNVTSVNVKDNPTPYNVYYGIRLYYKFQRDGALMNTHVLQKLKRISAISIQNELYDVIFVSYKNPNSTYREFGDFKANKTREFTDQYLYRIEINLEGLEAPVNKKLVTEGVVIRTEIKK